MTKQVWYTLLGDTPQNFELGDRLIIGVQGMRGRQIAIVNHITRHGNVEVEKYSIRTGKKIAESVRLKPETVVKVERTLRKTDGGCENVWWFTDRAEQSDQKYAIGSITI